MLQGEHFAIYSTFIKLPFVIKIFVLTFFEWLFYTGFTVYQLVGSRIGNCTYMDYNNVVVSWNPITVKKATLYDKEML